MVRDSSITRVRMKYTGLIPVKLAGVSPPEGKGKIETGDIVEVPVQIARNLEHDPNWESVNKISMKYTGDEKKPVRVAGVNEGKEILKDQVVVVPESIALFLLQGKNWKKAKPGDTLAEDKEKKDEEGGKK